MKRFIPPTLILTGLILMGAGASTAAVTAEGARAKAAELERLRHTIRELSNNLGSLRSQHKDERAKLRALNNRIRHMNRSLHKLEDQRRQQADRLARLRAQRQASQAQLARQQRTLAQLLRAAYLLEQESPIKILLNATEPATVERSLRYYDYFYRSRAEHIAAINTTLTDLNNLAQGIEHRQHKLDALIDRRNTQRRDLERSRHERNRLLAELNRDIKNTKQRLTRLKEDEQSLQELVKRLGRALVNIPSPGATVNFARLKGRLPMPARGTVTARFGASRHVGRLKWQGIVINAAAGADVKAVAAGRVVFADWLRGFGLLIIVDHGNGYMSLYGYNQELHKGVGDTVKAGEVIANVGSNGGHKQSGLYFEIRHQGTPINPLHWCKAR
ncbi:MAG: peptidoglycan DD-metalloendopeptidase family protein [Gammaproteobacteria bacterium]